MEKNQHKTESSEPVKVPIEDVLDLHTFLPGEVPSLLEEYLTSCQHAGIHSVRIIHGKGRGFLKDRVRSLLKKLSVVASFSDAPPSAGGWGATIVELNKRVQVKLADWDDFLKHISQGARVMGVQLNRSQLAQFGLHAKELVEWNRFANLTSIKDPIEMAEKQFLDSLSLLGLATSEARVMDIGSGGGFPGMPLKVMRPDLRLTLIDGSRKKVNFLKHIIRTIGLKNIEARHVRAEELARDLEAEADRYDVIVSKAVSRLDKLIDLALPLLHHSGMMIAMKGASVEKELEIARPKIKNEDLSLEKKEYRLPLLGIQRTLLILTRK
jgi:16S rRNA (guanine527-N7)-methyltransferase